jgi:hypothetical protein
VLCASDVTIAARHLIVEAFLGHHGFMFVLEVGMLLSLALGVVVVCVVAVPARRAGREMLTPKGEEVVSVVREKTGDALDAARDKVAEVTRTNQE